MRASGTAISVLLALFVAGCTGSSPSSSGKVASTIGPSGLPVASVEVSSTPLPSYSPDAGITSVLLAEDSQQNWYRMALSRTGILINTGRYQFSPDVAPVQALDGKLLLAVAHYSPPRACGPASCGAPIPTRSLAVADRDGQVLWQVADSLGECSATLVAGTNEIVTAVVTDDGHGHALAHIRLLGPTGIGRELFHFIPPGGNCPGTMSAAPDGTAVYVPAGLLGGKLFRVPLHSGAVTSVLVGPLDGHTVAVAVSPNGRQLAVSAMTERPISTTTDTNDFHLGVMPIAGGPPRSLAPSTTSLTNPVWAGPDLLIATQSEPRYALVLINLTTGRTLPMNPAVGFRVFGSFG